MSYSTEHLEEVARIVASLDAGAPDNVTALMWGGEDLVSLAKEVVALHKKPEYEKFTTRGGVMEGEKLTPEKVTEISKWPNRAGQISIVLGQLLSPGSKLLSQITEPGAKLLSQVKKKSEEEEKPAT